LRQKESEISILFSHKRTQREKEKTLYNMKEENYIQVLPDLSSNFRFCSGTSLEKHSNWYSELGEGNTSDGYKGDVSGNIISNFVFVHSLTID